MGRVMGAIVPRAMDAIDPDDIIERVDLDAALGRMDLDAVLARIDLQGLIERIDLDPVLDRVDLDALLARLDVDSMIQQVDVDALIQRVDIDALMGRIDIDALMAKVDIDALMTRIDINGLLDQVDLPALVARAGIDQIVRDATSGIATRTIDLARRQVLAVDVVALGVVDRALGRRPLARGDEGAASVSAVSDSTATVSTVTDSTALTDRVPGSRAVDDRRPGGPLARALAFLLDSVTVSATFGLLVGLGATLFSLFAGRSVDLASNGGPVYLGAYLGWWFLYLWITVSVAGRTVGKALVGLQVVSVDGGPLRPARSAVRVLVLPASLVFGLGFLPAVVGRSRRALHDLAAGSRVVVDWGGREVALPRPLHQWIAERSTGTT